MFKTKETYFICYYELNGGEVVITPNPAPQPSTQPTQESTPQQATQQTAQQQSTQNDATTAQTEVAKPKSTNTKKIKAA